MEYILTEKQLKLYHGSRKEGKPLSKFEVKLLKMIHEEKKEFTTKQKLIERIKDILPFLNLSPAASTYYYELYRANFRKDGDYENITTANFVDPQKGSGKTTLNTKAMEYSAALLPFKGSNLRGFWGKDGRGNRVYIINSYNWYPVYLYRDGKWYQVTERYSPATGRQMSNVRPRKWGEFDNEFFFLTPEEMSNLLRGFSHEELMNQKKEKLIGAKEKIEKSRQTRTTIYSRDNGWQNGPITVKYKVRGVEKSGDDIVIKVDILDVILRRQPQLNYLKGEIPTVDKDYVENSLSRQLNSKYQDYLGTADDYYYSTNPKPLNFDYEYKHLKPV